MKVEQIIDEMQASLTKLRGQLRDRDKGTAGECTCIAPMLHDPDCPKHGWQAIFKEQKATYDRIHKHPDLPLHARVAKALGMRPHKNANGWFYGGGHILLDYPNDLVAAMGALEEYCEKKKYERFGRLVYRPDSEDYAAEILDNSDPDTEWGKVWVTADTLPQAICEAIVAHREGK